MRIASGTALAMRAGVSRDVMEVHGMLTHPNEEITRNTAEMMEIETTGQWGACETCFLAKAKQQAVQWVDEHKKTGDDGTGSDNRGMKSRGTLQLNVQGLGQEQQLTLHEHETQQAFSENEGETQGTFSKLEEEKQEALSKVEEETQEALSEHEREQQQKEGEAGLASGSANLEGPALPALRKLTTERGTPQLNLQELGQEQQLTLHEHETQEAFSEHEGETQGTFSKLEETQKALSEVEEETQQALSEHA